MRFTTVIAIDHVTIDQLEISLPTWRLNQPNIFSNPILCLYDRSMGAERLRHLWRIIGDCEGGVKRIWWPPPGVPDDVYASQRERMLTAFMWGAAEHVETDVWIKLDTDVIALAQNECFVDPLWFATPRQASIFSDYKPPRWECEVWAGVNEQRRAAIGPPVIVAPKWHYTKCKDGRPWLKMLDEWGDSRPELNCYDRLNIPEEPGQIRVGHRRHCSWIAAYNTAWTREVVAMCDPPWKMPVPSQDTLAHYVASRRRDPWLAVNFKNRFLNNYPKMGVLREVAEYVLRRKENVAGANATA